MQVLLARLLSGSPLNERIFYISFFGLLVMLVIAWLLLDNRHKMKRRLIAGCVGLQVLLGVLLIEISLKERVFYGADKLIRGLMACSDKGASMVFGEELVKGSFAFSVCPMIIFFSSLTAVLFHLHVLQWIVKWMARAMVWVMDVSGAESLCASANVFLGITTAPLTVRPYLDTMTRSEIMALMVGGMATAAGSTMPIYVKYGAQPGHLLVASLMSAPAALVVAKIMVPETEQSLTKGMVKVEIPREAANVFDAACRGAADGLKLALNVAAMLIAFIALVYLVDWILLPTGRFLAEPLTLKQIFGWLGAPLAWVMGIEWREAQQVGVLLGEKTAVNEVVAFISLGKLQDTLSPRSFTIATYALCGFANFGSIAVVIGGVGGLAPERRKDFARYGFRSMLGGALAAFMTACVAGMLI
ncbi:MAG: NupC/NupG family nucleoside CNT transporter [Candidatus Nealsonbacteria bacterium]|nr:NupC/NupG family nucleoside CNT transporter [Candidatus Nealsonbacteria bacterium]